MNEEKKKFDQKIQKLLGASRNLQYKTFVFLLFVLFIIHNIFFLIKVSIAHTLWRVVVGNLYQQWTSKHTRDRDPRFAFERRQMLWVGCILDNL